MHGHSAESVGRPNSRLPFLRPARGTLPIFRGSRWLIGSGFNALILEYEANQASTNFKTSGDITRKVYGYLILNMCDYIFLV